MIDTRVTTASRVWRGLPWLVLLLALAGSLAYWPGLVTWDSLRQYDQALSGQFDDWHPPVMEWLWRQMLPLAHSPAPMLLLQLGLYGCGSAMLIHVMQRQRRYRTALAVACCTLQPIVIALMATIIKDSLMTGALLCAVGLVAVAEQARSSRAAVGIRLLAFVFCLFAATLRFNAFLAIAPLALWALPPCARTDWRKILLSGMAVTALMVAAMPAANALIGAERSDVQLSLVIFDLAGITEHSGVNVFPPLGIADTVEVNHRCYSPVKWDSYSWWVDDLCPINFELIRRYVHEHHVNPIGLWLSAIARHPLAYIAHRTSHWNINSRFLVAEEVERPVQVEAPPNEWHFAVTPTVGVKLVDTLALASAHSPLGWPWFWMTVMAAQLWFRRRHTCDLATILAISALFYGLGYAVFSVASELRYYHLTICAGALALTLNVFDRQRFVPSGKSVSDGQVRSAFRGKRMAGFEAPDSGRE